MARYIGSIALRVILVCGICKGLTAQTLTLAQALDAAEKYQPAIRSAVLQTKQQQQLLPGVTALANPVVTVESPSGNFYTAGVTQAFELPNAYRRRKALQQSRVALAESGTTATKQEIRYTTALAYNDLQYQIALAEYFRGQDSILQALSSAAVRQFEQGQIDAVARQVAVFQAATVHARVSEAEQAIRIAENQLQRLTGLSGSLIPELWTKPGIPETRDTASWRNSPSLQLLEQETRVAVQQVAVEKSGSWPQITVGYMNQGERNSPVANRFNIGLSMPLWRKQYRARVDAAKTGVELARENLLAQSLQVETSWQLALGEAEKKRKALEEYEQAVLPAARSLTESARRLYEGGLSDLPAYLRNRRDAQEAELDYIDLLKTWHEALINARFTTGNL